MTKPTLAFALFRRFVIERCSKTGELLTEELILSFWNDSQCERDGWIALANEAMLFCSCAEMCDIPAKINGDAVSKVN